MPLLSQLHITMPPFSIYVAFSVIWFGTNVMNIDNEIDLDHLLSEPIESSFKSYIRPTFLELINFTTKAPQCQKDDIYPKNTFESWNKMSHQWQLALWLRRLSRSLPNFLSLSNMGYCCLIILAKLMFRIFFGELRSQEKLLLREKLLHFFFYNLLYIFILSYVRTLQGVFLWGSWISILCFLHLLTVLCASRFDYLTYSPSTTLSGHAKLITLLFIILGFSSILCCIGLYVGLNTSNHVLFFMLTKSSIVILLTCHVLVQYGIHLYDSQYGGFWLARGTVKYYTDLVFDLISLTIDFCHHLHLLVWRNIFLSAASLMVLLQLRYLLSELAKRIFRHRNYLRLARLMDERFPLVKSVDDTCAICWSPLTLSRQLPCRHSFHDTCVRAWLEQDSSCPTCRKGITPLNTATTQQHPSPTNRNNSPNPIPNPNTLFTPLLETNRTRNNQRRTTHFFHLDGSRYFSWLGCLRVEVSQISYFGGARDLAFGDRHLLPNRLAVEPDLEVDHLEESIQQVVTIFPHLPHSVIREDLLQSGGVEATIENILEGRLYETASESTDSSMTDQSSDVESNKQSPCCPPNLSVLHGAENSSEHSNLLSDPTILVSGSRFSKSAREREAILAIRKKEMLLQAKKKYLTKIKETNHNIEHDATDTNRN